MYNIILNLNSWSSEVRGQVLCVLQHHGHGGLLQPLKELGDVGPGEVDVLSLDQHLLL